MPEITSCPECEKKLRVPDDLIGKKVRCPGCGSMFTAKVAGPARDEEEEEEERPRRPKLSGREGVREGRGARGRDRDEEDEEAAPRRRSRRDEEDDEDDRPRSRRGDYEDEDSRRRRRRAPRDEYEDEEGDYEDRPRGRDVMAWRGVRAGLNLVVIAGWLHIATVGVGILGAGLLMLLGVGLFSSAARQGPGAGPPSGAVAFGGGIIIFFCIVGLLGLAELIVRLIGWGMCMQVPSGRGSPARGLCIAAFCCACGAVLLGVTSGFISGASSGIAGNPMAFMGASNAVGWIGNVLALAAFILWIFFLRAVCLELRNSAVAGKVLTFFIAELVFAVLSTLLVVVMLVVIGAAMFGAVQRGGGLGAVGGGLIAFMIMIGLIVLVYVALYVWYVLIVQDVRGVVERHLARR